MTRKHNSSETRSDSVKNLWYLANHIIELKMNDTMFKIKRQTLTNDANFKIGSQRNVLGESVTFMFTIQYNVLVNAGVSVEVNSRLPVLVLPVSHGGLPGKSSLKAQTAVQLLRLLQRMLAHEVLLDRLVELSHELHRAVEEVHLVDEEVAEHAGAGHDDIDARAAELLKRHRLDLVDAPERVRQRPHAEHPEHLREGLAVGLDVVGAPEHEGDGLGILAAIVLHLAVEKAVDDRPARGQDSFLTAL